MKKQSTFKMKGFSGFKDESPVKNVFDTKKQKQTLKEYKSQQKDFLSNKDITANQEASNSPAFVSLSMNWMSGMDWSGRWTQQR